ncbi:MAG: hypothetical protein H0U40_14810 [Chloroflexia bacterium]|nr:hypothetical protein [Chloroflexia bacterium]MDQ3514884.1 hypothetical protein [Chloroflexota bacterium]
METVSTFEPGRYLTRVNNAEYLEVKWRLVWLRDQHPDAAIDTEMVSLTDQVAVFRARVSLPDGGSATGWGSESPSDFRDYIEKAETKSIGRALAALGFGTQFCPDFDFGAAAGRVVDAPIDLASTRGRQEVARRQAGDAAVARIDDDATPRQRKFIEAIAREAKLDSAALATEAEAAFGGSLDRMSRREASALIERLQARDRATRSDLAS